MKIHLAVDTLGQPIRVLLRGGQRNDITQAQALLAGLAPRHVLTDKGYDSRALVEAIQAQGARRSSRSAVASSRAPATGPSTACATESSGASHA